MPSNSGSAEAHDKLNSFNDPPSTLGTRSRRDRPWLLPTNRKLRHLQGLSLRNLTFSSASSKPRGTTTDDEVLSQSWQSPTKLLALQENPKLEHSRSSVDLPVRSSSAKVKSARSGTSTGTDQKENEGEAEVMGDGGDGVKKIRRPSSGRLRRRSTLNWAGASPSVRQKKLEDVIGARMGDTWFSLHAGDEEDPAYVSEVVQKAMNPNYQSFDLNPCGPSVSRLDTLTVRLWAKPSTASQYHLLVELALNMQSLQFIGKSLENFHHPLPSNCLIFHLTDGLYTNLTDLPPTSPPPFHSPSLALTTPAPFIPPPPPSPLASSALPTSSYDALMRLSTLSDCISDALTTRHVLTTQINALLAAQSPNSTIQTAASLASESLAATRRSLATERKALKAALARRSELQHSLHTRRHAIASGRAAQSRAATYLASSLAKLHKCRSMVAATRESLVAQRRRICRDLLAIFPIDPAFPHLDGPASAGRAYTIRGLHFPDTPIPASTPTAPLAAALGYTAQIVDHLALYLQVPLPYPLRVCGSTSTVEDCVAASLPAKERVFPLYPAGGTGGGYKFEYAVFLLNKDVECLALAVRVKGGDLRRTLGGVRGVLLGVGSGTPVPALAAGGATDDDDQTTGDGDSTGVRQAVRKETAQSPHQSPPGTARARKDGVGPAASPLTTNGSLAAAG